jgi:hypothetical protein
MMTLKFKKNYANNETKKDVVPFVGRFLFMGRWRLLYDRSKFGWLQILRSML